LDPINRYLIHACLEGPEAGVYYRGKATIREGEDVATVNLPDYACTLATDFTVQVTPIYNGRSIRTLNVSAIDEEHGTFNVYGPPGDFSWVVYGKRLSITNIEPLKKDVEVKGDGPYRYI
jgi:hypothetical protein